MYSEIFIDPVKFAETFLYIYDKDQRRVKLNFNTVQKDYIKNRTKQDLILKARQFGVSTAIEALLFHTAVTSRASVAILAHNDDTTQKLRRMSNRFWENMPKEFRPKRKYSNDRLVTYTDFDSEIMIATAGNSESGRGGTYSHIHGSEVAFWKDAEKLISGIMQGGNPYIALESTPNGAQGYFYQTCMDSLDGKNDWKLHFYAWWFDGQYREELESLEEALELEASLTDEENDLIDKHGLSLQQIKWRRKKIRLLKNVFYQEYPENPRTCFLLSGNGYFGDVSKYFTADLNANYNPDFKYYAGLDFGQSNDYTVLSIVCKNTRQQVKLIHLNNLGWGEMRRQIALACKEFNVKSLWAEKNSMGSTNIEELRKEFTSLGQRTRITEFQTTNNTKHEIMSSLHEALHEDGFRLLDIEGNDLANKNSWSQKREFNAFISSQTPTGIWQLKADGSEHDDCVIATALSWQASIKAGAGFG